ncbi:hypothetical protein RC62_3975 [Flavobacterium aquidurense]|uniref:Uncharacterized protein n=1 Tax=Flavobacterium aquidurense TaxID=362413 RepID=A0A0Q0S7V8_9FLAO|nr:hypothetical protein RC62_3975 [Flavobacterium aquidurense]
MQIIADLYFKNYCINLLKSVKSARNKKAQKKNLCAFVAMNLLFKIGNK